MNPAAPTNEAFEDLPEGTLDSLLLPQNKDALIDILKHHVVAANTPSSSLSSGKEETLKGYTIDVTVSDADIMVDDANVVVKDVIASNGIIHAIDSVLIPSIEIDSIYDTAAGSEDFTVLGKRKRRDILFFSCFSVAFLGSI